MQWHQYTKNQIEIELKTSLETGLSQNEAKFRLLKDGYNVLPDKPPESWVIIFFRQFKSPLIYILAACSAIIFYLGERPDAAIILVVLLVNAVIGMIQEGRAGKILQSLKKMSSAEATVLRGGVELIIPEAEVVAGDILILKEGQRVAADAHILFSHNLSVDESALTGESGSVSKKEGQISESQAPVTSQHNMVFKGTAVLGGDGHVAVVGIGINTEVGKISKALLAPDAEMPLQKNIKKLSKIIIYVVAAISIGVFILGINTGIPGREMFSLVVSLALSIIPEGLPLIITLILVHGVWRLAKKNALVRKLPAVEALGQANIIAVDKTGTITENQMVVKQLYSGKKVYRVTGNGYKPVGSIFLGDNIQHNNANVAMSATIVSLASKASLQLIEETGSYKISGDPTEAAMLVFGEKLGFSKEKLLVHYREVGEIPFEFKNKYRAVFYEHDEKVFYAVTGAPEVILSNSTHFLENGLEKEILALDREFFEGAVDEFSSKGLRVVAFGYKHSGKTHALNEIKRLTFVGLLGIEDAIRPEARSSVAFAHSANIKVVMITGDLKNTAKSIALEAGIFKDGDIVLTGTELAELSASELKKKLPKISVFARVTPEDKMTIIKAYKDSGFIVAMTGDGVNDAPSLVAADLGVAMGKIGTEVAKEAADIVLLDDNLSTFVAAIKEGRVMFANIRKSLQFLFSTSLGELLTIVISLFLRLPLPVIAVQILWLNLITDPLSGAALALEKEDGDILHIKKSSLSKFFLDKTAFIHMGVIGLVMAAGTIYIFNAYYFIDQVKAQTLALTLLAVFQWYNAFNCRFATQSIFNKRIFSNGYVWLALGGNFIMQVLAVYNSWFNKILHTKPISFVEWALVLTLGFSIILADEARKFFLRKEKFQRF
jgi:Ca2+-transporting ATPase